MPGSKKVDPGHNVLDPQDLSSVLKSHVESKTDLSFLNLVRAIHSPPVPLPGLHPCPRPVPAVVVPAAVSR